MPQAAVDPNAAQPQLADAVRLSRATNDRGQLGPFLVTALTVSRSLLTLQAGRVYYLRYGVVVDPHFAATASEVRVELPEEEAPVDAEERPIESQLVPFRFPRRIVQLELALYDDGLWVATVGGLGVFGDGPTDQQARASLLERAREDLEFLRARRDRLGEGLSKELDMLEDLFGKTTGR